MRSTRAIGDSHDEKDIRWTPMLALSGLLHLVVFLLIMFVPESIPSSRGIKGIVYEVNLVEMPSTGGMNNEKEQRDRSVHDDKGKAVKTITRKDTKAKRIQAPEEKKKPLVVAKRTIIKKSKKITKPKVPPSQLIEKAISRIEKKVEEEENDPVENAISKLKEKVGTGYGRGPSGGGGTLEGLPMRIYQMEVETWIKGNWSYPVAIREQKKLEAIVLLKVKEDGTILESTFKKRSADIIFDQSVEKAIEKSDPLPHFPEGYRKSYEEFEINFNLKDLEDG